MADGQLAVSYTVEEIFMARGKTIFRRLLLMVAVLPAVLLNTARRPAAPVIMEVIDPFHTKLCVPCFMALEHSPRQ